MHRIPVKPSSTTIISRPSSKSLIKHAADRRALRLARLSLWRRTRKGCGCSAERQLEAAQVDAGPGLDTIKLADIVQAQRAWLASLDAHCPLERKAAEDQATRIIDGDACGDDAEPWLAITRTNQVWALDISAPCRRGLQRQREGRTRRSANRSWLIHDRQLQRCLAPVEAGRKGAAKLGRLPTAGCHAQSSLKCTEQGRLRPVRRATARSMVRQRSVRWKPLYLVTPRPCDGHRGAIRLGLMFPSGECARAHSAMEFLPQPSPRATRGRARHLRT